MKRQRTTVREVQVSMTEYWYLCLAPPVGAKRLFEALASGICWELEACCKHLLAGTYLALKTEQKEFGAGKIRNALNDGCLCDRQRSRACRNAGS